MITGAQIREARRLLGWSADYLASRAKVAVTVIDRAELVDGEPPITTPHAQALKAVLEAAGLEFQEGQMGGVTLSRSRPAP